MRAVVQRVARASVSVNGRICSDIGRGLLIMVGVSSGDTERDCDVLADKIDGLRIFSDEAGRMNLSVNDVGGSILIVSQFTLEADVRRGKRPSFSSAARPENAVVLYRRFCARLRSSSPVCEGVFGADMQVALVNDGPVTIIIDSKDLIKNEI